MTAHSRPTSPHPADASLHQGACVQLGGDAQLYQVIGIDDHHDRCWLRRWPLARQGSEVFEISLQQVQPVRPHRS